MDNNGGLDFSEMLQALQELGVLDGIQVLFSTENPLHQQRHMVYSQWCHYTFWISSLLIFMLLLTLYTYEQIHGCIPTPCQWHLL